MFYTYLNLNQFRQPGRWPREKVEDVMRNAVIVKKIEFSAEYAGWPACEPTKKSYGYIYIDTWNKKIGYYHKQGTAPTADLILFGLMVDRDVYRLAKRYTKSERKCKYEIVEKVGQSGCADYFINIYNKFGYADIIRERKHLLHISCAGKINQDVRPMYIGDFVELFKKLVDPDELPFIRKEAKARLRKTYGLKYIYEKPPHGELTSEVSNIFD